VLTKLTIELRSRVFWLSGIAAAALIIAITAVIVLFVP
jgi:hypothetical protein